MNVYGRSSVIAVGILVLATPLAAQKGPAAGKTKAPPRVAVERRYAMAPDASVPGTDGEPAGRLLEMTRVQAKLARGEGGS